MMVVVAIFALVLVASTAFGGSARRFVSASTQSVRAVPMVASKSVHSIAFSAATTTVCPIEIIPGQFVTLGACGLRDVPRRLAFAAHDVDSMRHRLEVRRIATAPHAAQMIECETICDLADEESINKTVPEPRPSFVLGLSVSTSSRGPKQAPASGIRNRNALDEERREIRNLWHGGYRDISFSNLLVRSQIPPRRG